MKNKTLTSLKLLVGISLMMILIFKVGVSKLLEILSNMPLIVIFIFVLSFAISIFIGAVNIKLFSDAIKKIPFLNMIRYYLLSWSVGLISPGKIGEFSIILFLKRKGRLTYGQGLAISIIDKIITVVSLVIISSLIVPYFFPEFGLTKIIILLLTGITILMYLILSKKTRVLIKKYLLRGYAIHFSKFDKTFKKLIFKHYLRIIINLLLTVLKWFSTAIFTYIALIYLREEITLFKTFVIGSTGMLISTLPISLNGLGIREITFVGLMSYFGVNEEVALSLSILALIVSYSIASLSTIFIKLRNKNFEEGAL